MLRKQQELKEQKKDIIELDIKLKPIKRRLTTDNLTKPTPLNLRKVEAEHEALEEVKAENIENVFTDSPVFVQAVVQVKETSDVDLELLKMSDRKYEL